MNKLVFALAVSAGMAACSAEPDTSFETATLGVPAGVETLMQCERGTRASGAVVDVRGSENLLYTAPPPAGEKIVNERATEMLGETYYHSIDASTRVRVLCTEGDYAQISVTEPEWLEGRVGWVKADVLLQPQASGSARVFAEEDIYWDKDTKQHKEALLRQVNRIHAENPACTGKLDPGTLTKSPSKSRPGAPVFFVTCGSGPSMENVFFTLEG